MNTKLKFAAALTALTVAATFAIPSSEAQARRWGHHWGYWGVGALATGVVLGAAIASQPVVVAPRRCWREPQVDAYGRYMGRVTVCSRAY